MGIGPLPGPSCLAQPSVLSSVQPWPGIIPSCQPVLQSQAHQGAFPRPEAGAPDTRGENGERERLVEALRPAGLLTHLSEEPVVDKVDHKDLRDEEKALLLSPGLPGCRDGLLAFFFLAPREAAGVGVAWAFRGFLILPL